MFLGAFGAAGAGAATLAEALTSAGVPADEQTQDLATARAASTLAKRLGGSRGKALTTVLRSTTAIANQPSFSPALARVVFRELAANVGYLDGHSLPAAGTRVRIDGVVYESYAGQGLRIQPLGTFFAILEPGAGIAAEGGVGAALDTALTIAIPQGDGLTLPYLFPWMGHAAPWESAMAEGVAAAAAIRTWSITADDRHLDAAIRFGSAAVAHGVGTDGGGLWFPLYVSAPDYRVLNGHLQTVLALNDLAEATGDEAFDAAFTRGVLATRSVLAGYDTGGWGRYAPGADAPVKYMTLMRDQLKQLGRITGDTAFTDLGIAFGRDLITPPVITGPAELPKPVRLSVLKKQKSAQIKVRIRRDKPVKLTIRLVTKAGAATKAGPLVVSVGSGSSVIAITVPKAPGAYTVLASATDWSGNEVTDVEVTTLRIRR